MDEIAEEILLIIAELIQKTSKKFTADFGKPLADDITSMARLVNCYSVAAGEPESSDGYMDKGLLYTLMEYRLSNWVLFIR